MGRRLGTCAITASRHTHLLRSYDFDRLTDKHELRVRRMKTRLGDRAFSAAGPSYWNSLPSILHVADSVNSFKTGLKTYLFSWAYSAVLTVRRPCSGMAVLRRQLQIVVVLLLLLIIKSISI